MPADDAAELEEDGEPALDPDAVVVGPGGVHVLHVVLDEQVLVPGNELSTSPSKI